MLMDPEFFSKFELEGKSRGQLLTTIRSLKKNIAQLKMTIESRYELEESEQMNAKDQDNINLISEIGFMIGGYFGGFEIRTVTIGEEVDLDVLHFPYEMPIFVKEQKKEISPDDIQTLGSKESFLNSLKSLHLGEWNRKYEDLSVLDGTQWCLTIKYSNEKRCFRVSGSNAYPYNFNEMQKILGIDLSNDVEKDEPEPIIVRRS